MNLLRQLVRGYVWKCRMSNGAVFGVWTPINITRKEAVNELLEFANPQYYEKKDIESVWKTARY